MIRQLTSIVDGSHSMIDDRLDDAIRHQRRWSEDSHVNMLMTSCMHGVKKCVDVRHGSPAKNYDANEYECSICMRPAFMLVDVYSDDLHASLDSISDESQRSALTDFDLFIKSVVHQADSFQVNPFTSGALYDSDQIALFQEEMESGCKELAKLSTYLQQGFNKLNIEASMNQQCKYIMIIMQSFKSLLNYVEITGFAVAVKRFGKVYAGLYTLSRLILARLMCSLEGGSPSPRTDCSAFFDGHAKRLAFSLSQALDRSSTSDTIELFSTALESSVVISSSSCYAAFIVQQRHQS